MPEIVEILLTKKAIKSKIKSNKLTLVMKASKTGMPMTKVFESIYGEVPKLSVRGKILVFGFKDKELLIHANLKGKWTEEKTPNTKMEMHFSASDTSIERILYYEDTGFGYIKLVANSISNSSGNSSVNIGPNANKISKADFDEILESKRNIYSILTDQKKIAGIGNYLAAEILHAAGIDPRVISNKLDADERKRLYNSISTVIKNALEHGGSPHYPIFGKKGSYKPKVYKVSKKTVRINNRTVYI